MRITHSPYTAKDDQELMVDLWSPAIKNSPIAYVRYAFPWGQENTPLHEIKEPRSWQIEELEKMTDHIQSNVFRISQGLDPLIYYSAIVAGRGVGKSAFFAMVDMWALSCVIGITSISTANTETQLLTKTWPEVGKWKTMAINSHWFEKTALMLKPAPWYQKCLVDDLKVDPALYFAQAMTWSEENPDSFAGQHNVNGMIVKFDEASGIPKKIHTVTEGFFTEKSPYRFWFQFSNGRRNTGPFFDAFHKDRDLWNRRNIDGRTVEGTDKAVYERIIKKYGSDSDEARVEVYGQFPRQGDKQFISRSLIDDALVRPLIPDPHEPLIMGVDPARFGDDKTVIRFRQGRDGRSFPVVELKSMDNMAVADICASWIRKANPDAVCIDAGNGTGVIDRLRQLGYKVHEVWFGAKSGKPEWFNKRTEIWADMRDWLRGGCIDGNVDLIDDLAGPQYGFPRGGKSDAQILEPKEDMKERGLPSPDHADALACTFAVHPARHDLKAARKNPTNKRRIAKDVEFPLFT
jgi:hypothetical protein